MEGGDQGPRPHPYRSCFLCKNKHSQNTWHLQPRGKRGKCHPLLQGWTSFPLSLGFPDKCIEVAPPRGGWAEGMSTAAKRGYPTSPSPHRKHRMYPAWGAHRRLASVLTWMFSTPFGLSKHPRILRFFLWESQG